MAEVRKSTRKKDFKIELLVIFAILISLGFPGSFTKIYGDRLGTVLEYGAFFIEILAILLSSGESWLDIRLINLDRKYFMMYVFAAVVFIQSMLVTRYPSEQFISCARLCVTMLFAIWLQSYFEFKRMIELIGIAQALFVLFCILFIVRYPGYAYESGSTFTHALKGLYFTKNSFAYELTFGILIISLLIRGKRKKREPFKGWLGIQVVQILLILMCQATGPVLCTMAALTPLFMPKNIRLPLGLGYITGNVVFLFGTLSFMPYFEWFFEAIGKDATLTGRIPLWNRIVEVMMGNQTMTGFGYAMFWRDPKAYELVQKGFDRWSSLSKITSGAHNVLLELWLNIGLIGIACFFLMVLYSMRDIDRISAERYYFCSVILIYLAVCGLAERCLGGTYDFKTLGLFLVMAAGCNGFGPERKPYKIKEKESASA